MDEDKNKKPKNDKKEKFKNFGKKSSKINWLWGGVTLFIVAILAIWGWSVRTRFYDFNKSDSTNELSEIKNESNFSQQLSELKNQLQASKSKAATQANTTTTNTEKEFVSKLSKTLSTSTAKKETETSTVITTTKEQATTTNQTKSN